MTYARLTTLQADPTKLDEGARYFREWVTTTGRQQQGFQGARLLVDRRARPQPRLQNRRCNRRAQSWWSGLEDRIPRWSC
jgi:hypothetical protein